MWQCQTDKKRAKERKKSTKKELITHKQYC